MKEVDLKILVEGLFGSHLYGLSRPESDKDYKGVYLPEVRDILLGSSKKTIDVSTNKSNVKNTSDDIDRQFYSLDYFIRQACKGETFAIDMLHMSEKGSWVWQDIVSKRTKFYSKDMKAFIGYAQRQAAKYSIKGSRLDFLERTVDWLFTEMSIGTEKMGDCWSGIEVTEFSSKDELNELVMPYDCWWHVTGKKFNAATPVSHVYDSLKKIKEGYGHRAELAKSNNGVDWKAVSHAFRAAYQLRDIFKEGDFEYPLKESKFIMQVKQGELDFVTEVQDDLENLIDEVKSLAEKSSYPDKVNVDYWENYIYDLYLTYVSGEISR